LGLLTTPVTGDVSDSTWFMLKSLADQKPFFRHYF
jgi:hypothetical protein